MVDAQLVSTHPVRVKIFVRSGAVIAGLAHIKPGAYQRRVSDVLNLGQVKYIPVTDVEYRFPGEPAVVTDCMLINVADISMVDVTPPRDTDLGKTEPLLPGASA